MRAAVYLRAAPGGDECSPARSAEGNGSDDDDVTSNSSPSRTVGTTNSSSSYLAKPAAGGATCLLLFAPRTVQRLLRDESSLRQKLEVAAYRAVEHVYLDHLRLIAASLESIAPDFDGCTSDPCASTEIDTRTLEMIESEEAARRAFDRNEERKLAVLHHKIFLLEMEESSTRVQIQRKMEPMRYHFIAKSMVSERRTIWLEVPRKKIQTIVFVAVNETEQEELAARMSLQNDIILSYPVLFPNLYCSFLETGARTEIVDDCQQKSNALRIHADYERRLKKCQEVNRVERSQREEIFDDMSIAFYKMAASVEVEVAELNEKAWQAVSAAPSKASRLSSPLTASRSAEVVGYRSDVVRQAQARIIRQRQAEENLKRSNKDRVEEEEETPQPAAVRMAWEGSDEVNPAASSQQHLLSIQLQCVEFDERHARVDIDDEQTLGSCLAASSFARLSFYIMERLARAQVRRSELDERSMMAQSLLVLPQPMRSEVEASGEPPLDGQAHQVLLEGVHRSDDCKKLVEGLHNDDAASSEQAAEELAKAAAAYVSRSLRDLVSTLQSAVNELRSEEESDREGLRKLHLDSQTALTRYVTMQRDERQRSIDAESLQRGIIDVEAVEEFLRVAHLRFVAGRELIYLLMSARRERDQIQLSDSASRCRSIVAFQQGAEWDQVGLLFSEGFARIDAVVSLEGFEWVLMMDVVRREDSEREAIALQQAQISEKIDSDQKFELEQLARTEVDRLLQNEVAEGKRTRRHLRALLDDWQKRAVEMERAGAPAQAVVYRRFCVDVLEKMEGSGSVELALGRVALGSVLEASGNLTEAHEQCLAALPTLDRYKNGSSVELASLLSTIALQCRRLCAPTAGTGPGDAAKMDLAFSSLTRCVKIRRELTPNALELASAHNVLSSMHRAKGDDANALSNLYACLEIQRQHADEFNDAALLDLATSHSNLAVLFAAAGDNASALVQLKRGLAIRDHANPTSPATANAYTVAASMLRKSGQLADALEMLEHGAEIRRAALKAQPQMSPPCARRASSSSGLARKGSRASLDPAPMLDDRTVEMASLLRNMGKTQVLLKKLNEAESSYLLAREILEEVAPSSLELADTLYSLGKVQMAQGNLTGSLQQLNRCLALQQKIGVEPEDIQSTQKKIRAVFVAQKELDAAAGGVIGGAATIGGIRDRLTMTT